MQDVRPATIPLPECRSRLSVEPRAKSLRRTHGREYSAGVGRLVAQTLAFRFLMTTLALPIEGVEFGHVAPR